MKKFLFLVVVLTASFTIACLPTSPAGNNANQPVNQNVNQPISVNTNSNVVLFDRNDKGVVINLVVMPDGTKKITILTGDGIKLKKGTEKLHFILINNLHEDVGDVKMPFKTTDPFDGTPPFVAPGPTGKDGGANQSQIRKAKGAAGIYKYSVIVYGTDGNPLPDLPPLDPQVEIVG